VREVVRLAGFRITSETGSALVAVGGDASFYVWTTESTVAEILEAGPHWKRLSTTADTPVYGEARLWRFWGAQGFIFWLKQGPTATAVLPRPIDLRPLIEASKTVRPPPP
jgi:hypothetical protein